MVVAPREEATLRNYIPKKILDKTSELCCCFSSKSAPRCYDIKIYACCREDHENHILFFPFATGKFFKDGSSAGCQNLFSFLDSPGYSGSNQN